MAWNEPGNEPGGQHGGKKNDPWKNNKRGGNKQPPDLVKLIKEFADKLSNKPGANRGKKSPFGRGGSGNNNSSVIAIVGVAIAVLFVLWLLFGIYFVKPPERAAVFTFGRYVKTVGEGPHWIAPGIQSHKIVNVTEVNSSRHYGSMLTQDQNIVDVELNVQYLIGDVEAFLFNVEDPVYTLQEATDSALRQTIGNMTLNEVLTSERDMVRQRVEEEVKAMMEDYGTGLYIIGVLLDTLEVPDPVKEAFYDAIKAEEDEQRMEDQARAYAERNVPQAQGRAQAIIESATAYKEASVLAAEGESQRFLDLLAPYQDNMSVMRERLYISAMQQVLADNPKVILDDNEQANSVIFLPLGDLEGSSSVSNQLPPIIMDSLNLYEGKQPGSNSGSLSNNSNAHSTVSSRQASSFRDRQFYNRERQDG